ncbi:chorismate-binding protein [Micrococcus luteus]|uniref:chorismate-binding protein n=1 Tax=Micrococcus luteus TaxID=1270 RepID=UPI00214FB63F|nr:chorismate-binding protein [Micrococcus luteus]MCR4487587.1 chorismate-binding protein [Micrococcus luteus]
MTQTQEQASIRRVSSWGASFAVFSIEQAVVIPDPEIRTESLDAAQRRALNAETGHVLGILIPFEKNAPVTTYLGGPSPQPSSDAVEQPGSFDATALTPDIRFNERETARYMLALDQARHGFDTDPELVKVVLSRAERYVWEGMPPHRFLLSRIHTLYPDAYRYHAQTNEDASTVVAGATPELFLSKKGNTVRLQPLAGTVPASLSKAEAEKQLQTPKYLEEHRLLVDFMVSRLHTVSTDVTVAEEPSIVPANNVWHLGTPIRAELQDSVSIATLVDLLHPSPAVCGVDQARASAFISEVETARGYYGGLIGWLTPEGDGELYVALRGLEIDDCQHHVTLRAGGGITAASEPTTEFAETSDKLNAMRRVVGV